jgi:hypothetical protein
MALNFKEWLESKRPVAVNSDVKKWFDSADKLKQTIEKLKAALKNKKPETDKDKEKELIKVNLDKKLDKPEIGDKDKEGIKGKPLNKEVDKDKGSKVEKDVKKDVPEKSKFIQKPTKIEKDDKKGLNNGRRSERSDI